MGSSKSDEPTTPDRDYVTAVCELDASGFGYVASCTGGPMTTSRHLDRCPIEFPDDDPFEPCPWCGGVGGPLDRRQQPAR